MAPLMISQSTQVGPLAGESMTYGAGEAEKQGNQST